MSSSKQIIASLLILMTLLHVPAISLAERKKETYTYATPGEARSGGQFVHGGKPGVLLIRVYILGAVGQQGIHFFPDGTDILDAMLYAGGMADTTKLNGIQIRRKDVADLIDVDLEDLIEDGEAYPKLKDGDVVQVPWNWRRDIATIGLITGFLGSMTAFTLSLIALSRQ